MPARPSDRPRSLKSNSDIRKNQTSKRRARRQMLPRKHALASPALAPAIDRRHPDCLNRFPTMQLAHSRSDVFGNEVGVFSESAACARQRSDSTAFARMRGSAVRGPSTVAPGSPRTDSRRLRPEPLKRRNPAALGRMCLATRAGGRLNSCSRRAGRESRSARPARSSMSAESCPPSRLQGYPASHMKKYNAVFSGWRT